MTVVIQMVVWAAIIVLLSVIIYKYIIVGGTGPIPGENLLP